MTSIDYNSRESDEQWCEQQRSAVAEYLQVQDVKHGRIGEWPAWHVAPYVSIWAIESLVKPEWIGWWVISGDLPTDYISAADIEPPQHPRKALKAIADRWLQYVDDWKQGRDPKGYWIGSPGSFGELASLLAGRANLLREWAKDNALWDEE